jgi:hypothetical protein
MPVYTILSESLPCWSSSRWLHVQHLIALPTVGIDTDIYCFVAGTFSFIYNMMQGTFAPMSHKTIILSVHSETKRKKFGQEMPAWSGIYFAYFIVTDPGNMTTHNLRGSNGHSDIHQGIGCQRLSALSLNKNLQIS